MVGLKHYTLECMKAKAMINEKRNTHYYRTIPCSAQCTIIHSHSSQTKLKSVSSTPAPVAYLGCGKGGAEGLGDEVPQKLKLFC